MKNMQTPSHRFMAVRFETTGNFERNLKVSEFSFKLAKKSSLRIVFSWIGKPSKYKENNLIKSHNLGGAKLASHSRSSMINIFYLLEVVKKFSMVVTPRVTLAGSAFHSIQKVTKDDVTRIIPETERFLHPKNVIYLSSQPLMKLLLWLTRSNWFILFCYHSTLLHYIDEISFF